MTLYDVARGIAKMFLPIIYRLKSEGIENIPQDKSFILCSNHISFLDPVFIVLKIKSQCFFMGKQELFKNRIFGYLFRKLGAFPVNRGKGDTVAVEYAESLVKDGKIFAIFPEGTRSKTGKLLKLKSGAIVIAARTGGDILPCVIKKSKGKFLRKTVTVKYGKLIPNSDLEITENSTSQIKNANRLLSNTFSDLLEGIYD